MKLWVPEVFRRHILNDFRQPLRLTMMHCLDSVSNPGQEDKYWPHQEDTLT
jgi:hypothetical protein